MPGISFVEINSFLSYIFPILELEFLNILGDLRVEFLISRSLIGKIRVACKSPSNQFRALRSASAL